MKILVILLLGFVFGLSAAMHEVVTGSGFLAALTSYLVVGMVVTFAGVAMLVLQEVLADKAVRPVRGTALETALVK